MNIVHPNNQTIKCERCAVQESTLHCTTHQSNLCLECSNLHLTELELQDHKIIELQALRELEIQQEKELIQRTEEISSILYEKLTEEKKRVEKLKEELETELLYRKKEMITEINLKYDQVFTEISMDYQEINSKIEEIQNSIREKNCKLLDSIVSLDHARSLIFSENFVSKRKPEFSSLILNEFNLKTKFYEHGKSDFIHFFQPGKKYVKVFDVFSKSNSLKSVDFDCKDYPSITYDAEGNIFYSGGWNGHATNDVYLVDSLTFEHKNLPPMIKKRYQHSSSFCKGILYVFGGIHTVCEEKEGEKEELVEKPTKSCEKFNGMNWEMLRNELTNELYMGGICECSGKIYLTGRKNIEIFDTDTETFSIVNVNWPGRSLSIAVNMKNRVIIFRGDSLGELDPKGFYFRTSNLPQVEWWTSSPVISIGSLIFFNVDSRRSVYSFDYDTKSMEYFTY